MHGTFGVIDILFQNPSVSIKSILTTVHLLGLVFGLGAATMLDLIILRFLIKNRVSGEHWSIIELLSKSVTAGLVMLWTSGLGFLLHYAIFDPDKLGNPKIWAKISIVAVLTMNGFFIHRIVLPQIRARIGRHLFQGMSTTRMRVLLVLGTISGTSWYVPLFLGAIPLFNFALSVPAFLMLYALLVLGAIFTALIIGRLVLPEPPTVTIPRGEYLALRRAARRERVPLSQHAVVSVARLSFVVRNGVGRLVPLRTAYQFAIVAAVTLGFTAVGSAIMHGSARPLDAGQSRGSGPVIASATPDPRGIAEDGRQERRADRAVSFRHGNLDEAQSALVPMFHIEPATAVPLRRDVASAEVSTIRARPAPSADPATLPKQTRAEAIKKSSVSGVWAPDGPACSLSTQGHTTLRTTISPQGAWAGDTTCVFKQRVEIQNGWKIVAACSSGSERWTANAKLVVDGKKLTWSSERGSQTYVRCVGT